MSERHPSRRRGVRLAGWCAVLLFLGLVARFWHPVYRFTEFLQLDAGNDELKIAAFRTYPVYVYRNTGGYDGLYYAQIAYHPTLAAAELLPAVDSLTYRARRILPSALAWLLAAGQPAAIVHIYSVLNLIAWLILAYIVWRVLPVRDARGWLAWAGLLFSAGALASVRFALTDLVALTILAGALAAAENKRGPLATTLLAAAGLARETSLAGLVGVLDRPWLSAANLRRAFVAAAPLALWIIYIQWRLGYNDNGLSNLTWPVVGYLEKWRATLAAFRTEGDWIPVATTLLALVGLTGQALYIALTPAPGDRWWRIGAIYIVLFLCLNTAVWEGLPGAATRVLLPLSMAFNITAGRRGAAIGWLFLGNLTVASGLFALVDVHVDPRELTAVRAHGTGVVATLGDGWYGEERTSRHYWAWCQGDGRVTLEAWPKADRRVALEFSLRSTRPRTVIVRQGERELWRGEVTTTRGAPQYIEIAISNGRGALEFRSLTPPVREGAGDESRALAFAIYDARLTVLPD